MQYTIKELRKRKEMSARQLAKKLGVCIPTIYNWEKGLNKPNYRYVQMMAKIFDVGIDDIKI